MMCRNKTLLLLLFRFLLPGDTCKTITFLGVMLATEVLRRRWEYSMIYWDIRGRFYWLNPALGFSQIGWTAQEQGSYSDPRNPSIVVTPPSAFRNMNYK